MSESEVFDDLLVMSRRFARSAVEAYCEDDLPVFFLHAATAFELLTKALLAQRHPALLADTQRADEGFHSLLHLCGLVEHAEFHKVRTVSAPVAYQRARVLVKKGLPALEKSPTLRTLLLVRNGVVHLGSLHEAEAHRVFSEFASLANVMLDDIGQSREDYWGGHLEFVGRHLEKEIAAAKASALRRIEAAKARNEELRERMRRAEYAKLVKERALPPSYKRKLVECPACGATAELRGNPHVTSWSGRAVDEIELEVEYLNCDVCDLELDAPALEALGYDTYPILSSGADFDGDEAGEELYEPDEDDFRHVIWDEDDGYDFESDAPTWRDVM